MANNLEFILRLQDMLTPGMRNAASASSEATSKIQGNMHQVEHSADGATGGVARLKVGLGGLLKMAAPLVAAFSSFEFFKGSVEKYNEASQAQAQLQASLRSTKGAAGLTAEALNEQAEALQKTTLYDHDATNKMQSVLLTFTSVKGAIFTQAVPAIQDLAAKMGGDLQGAAVQVGKALQDPVRGITALRRVGVDFSDHQQEVIQNLVDTGQTAKAQALILKELNNEFGGSAAAAAAAGTGPFTQLAQKFGDVREEIGGMIVKLGTKLMPVLDGLINLVSGVVKVFKDIYHWCQRNSEMIGTVTVVILGLAAAVTVGYIAYQTYVLWSERAAIWSGIKAAVTAIETAALMGLGGALEFVNAMFLASPVGWIVLGVIALIAVIGYLIYAFDGWGKTWHNLMDVGKNAIAAYKDFVVLEWLLIKDAFMTGIETIEKGWYHLKSLWDKESANASLAKINDLQNARAAEIATQKGVIKQDITNALAAAKWEVHSNGKGMGTIMGDIKKKLGFTGGVVNPTTANAAGGVGTGGKLDTGDLGKDKADSINQGGQRSIVINIGKQIEKIEQHIFGGGREAAEEIESAIQEAMRRVVYSLNGVAS